VSADDPRPPWSGTSLARRLLMPLIWAWLLGLAAAALGALLLARYAAHVAFDRGLQHEAAALATRVTWSDRGPLLDLSRQAMELRTWDAGDLTRYAMVDLDGGALAGDARVPFPPDRSNSFEQPRLFDAVYDGQPVRGAVFSVRSPMLDRMVSIVVVETTHKRSELLRDLQVALLGPALVLGAMAFVLLGWNVRRGLRPLRELATEVATKGVHDWRALPLSQSPAEVAPLIERINQLMHNVQHSVSLQRRFVADAAHQLRTPVAGIRVLAAELERELGGVEGLDGAQWQPLLEQIRSSSDRLARLIAQLLSLARSETELTVDGEQRSQDIVPLLRESTEAMVLHVTRAGRSIELQAPDGPVPARAHPIWLGEVLNNLLDNAQRYGGPHIRMSVEPLAGGGAEVVVEDDGPGVAPDQLSRLFEPFWRGDRADTRNDGGTGLGLAIAREIVERLGGSLTAQSRPDVDGMRFVLRLQA
jgi:two-component system, OmpR family, sensor histidine kinase TctE